MKTPTQPHVTDPKLTAAIQHIPYPHLVALYGGAVEPLPPGEPGDPSTLAPCPFCVSGWGTRLEKQGALTFCRCNDCGGEFYE